MLVYLLVHLPSEMSYVGSTECSAEERFAKHWKDRRKDPGELAQAMRQTERRDWLIVTLERYDDVGSMLDGERDWILELETQRPGVGYNSQVPRRGDAEARAKRPSNWQEAARAAGLAAAARRPTEFYRECGRAAYLGRTREQLSDAGKLGAAARWAEHVPESKSQPSAKPGRSWWDSLSPEQREAHREAGRAAATKQRKSSEDAATPPPTDRRRR
jgi:hypothetical protein